MRRFLPYVATIAVAVLMGGPLQAQERARPAIDRGVAFLKGQVNQLKDAGEAGISALALLKAGVPPNDPAFVATVARFSGCFTEKGYLPVSRGGPDNYEAAVVLITLVNLDAIGYKTQIDQVTQYILSKQMGNGSWDYSDRTYGDTSMSQYALLGLWEAENAGIAVAPDVWDRAATWYIGAQAATGSWNYRRDAGTPETLSMTGAGIGSLLLCQKQLARHRKGQDLLNPLMIPLTIDGVPFESRYKVTTSAASINSSVQKGISWLTKNWSLTNETLYGETPFYCLYGVERLAALDDTKTMESFRWYDKGLDFILSKQGGNGAWTSKYGEVPNTCWAILFSSKATVISLHKIEIRRLAGSGQKAGRNLPTDLSNTEVVNGQIVARPMGGGLEAMLKILEDPANDKFESALNGLLAKYQAEGPKALRPFKDRFRKQLSSREESGRVIAAWALGRTGDFDVAPILIKSLLDTDEDVVAAARTGLQLLSRKIEGYGPPDKATPEQQQEAAKKWLAWYQSVKPPDLDAPEDILPVPAAAKPAAAPEAVKP